MVMMGGHSGCVLDEHLGGFDFTDRMSFSRRLFLVVVRRRLGTVR
jgi:hypothetical protein